jgi:hypothetical protein
VPPSARARFRAGADGPPPDAEITPEWDAFRLQKAPAIPVDQSGEISDPVRFGKNRRLSRANIPTR